MSEQRPGDVIPHQQETEQVIDDRLVDTSNVAFIADATAAAGANPTKAEYDALVGKFNSVLQVLKDAGLIPSS